MTTTSTLENKVEETSQDVNQSDQEMINIRRKIRRSVLEEQNMTHRKKEEKRLLKNKHTKKIKIERHNCSDWKSTERAQHIDLNKTHNRVDTLVCHPDFPTGLRIPSYQGHIGSWCFSNDFLLGNYPWPRGAASPTDMLFWGIDWIHDWSKWEERI